MNHTPKCGIIDDMKTYTCRIHGQVPCYHYRISTTGVHHRTCKLCRADEVKKVVAALRLEIVAAYGGKCECCGETEPRFLTIDHVAGDGGGQNRLARGNKLYRQLKAAGFPKAGLRLLCFNCNCSKGQFGTCPHEERTP